jgi:hypothetical protein
MLKITVPKGTPAADMRSFDPTPGEFELLLGRRGTYTITDAKKTGPLLNLTVQRQGPSIQLR